MTDTFTYAIEVSRDIADLPPDIRSLDDHKLLELHKELEITSQSATLAANSLRRLIRSRQVPVDRETLMPVAFHEAGHAVADLVFGCPFREVSLSEHFFSEDTVGRLIPVPTAEFERLFKWQIDYCPEVPGAADLAKLEQQAIALLAGPEAERRFLGDFTEGYSLSPRLRVDPLWEMLKFESEESLSSDVEKVLRLAWALRLTTYPKSDRLREKFPPYFPTEWDDEEYPDGTPVARFDAFYLSLSDTNLRFLNQLAVKTRKLVDLHWHRVEALANALAERKKLSHHDCQVLLAV